MLIEEKALVYGNKQGTHAIIKAPYNAQMIAAIKAIPGAKWVVNGDKKYWAMPAEHLDAAKETVRPYYQIDGEESRVAWKVVRVRVRFEQHKTARVRKYGKAVMIDGTDLLNVDYGNTYSCSSDFDILEQSGGFIDGDEHSAYWTVEYVLTVKMRANARIEAVSGTYEIIEEV